MGGSCNDRNYSRKINKVARRKALAATLAKKYADGEVILVSSFDFSSPKTADAKGILSSLGTIKGVEDIAERGRQAALVVLPERDENTEKSFRNFGSVLVSQAKDINPIQLLSYKYVVVTEPELALSILAKRVDPKDSADAKTKTK